MSAIALKTAKSPASPSSVSPLPLVLNPIATPIAGESPPRWHAFDAARCAAMFLVVALHSALAYVTIPAPHLFWAARDHAVHYGFDLFFWWAVGVSMPIFFTLSGLFAAKTLAEKGPVVFGRDRAKRILVPMLAATAFILPLTLVIWDYGLYASERCSATEFCSLLYSNQEIRANVVGPAHLWFLYFLACDLLFLGYFFKLLGGSRIADRVSRGLGQLRTPARTLIRVAPLTVLILWWGHWRIGLDPVMGMHNRLLMDPVRFLHHSLFFLTGAALYPAIRDHGASWLRQGAGIMLAASVPCFAVRAWLLTSDLVQPLQGGWAWLSVASGSLFAWFSLFGLLGLFQTLQTRRSEIVSYLADASYWIYLIHFPIVGLIQADLLGWRMPALPKFALTLGLTMSLGLASYQLIVRHGRIGWWLHGPRDRMPSESASARLESNEIKRLFSA